MEMPKRVGDGASPMPDHAGKRTSEMRPEHLHAQIA